MKNERQMSNRIVTYIRMPADLKRWCEEHAEADGRTLSGWVAFQLHKLRRSKKASETD